MAASTSSTSLAVCSIRVPVGARTCNRNVPASTAGKKFCPKKIERFFKTLLKGNQWSDPKRDVLFACLFVVMALEPHDHCRHQCARKHIGRDDGEHDRLGQRHKEITRHSGQ